MNFAQPRTLWVMLAALPLIALFLWWAWRKRQQLVAQFIQSRLLESLTRGISKRNQRIRLALLWFGIAFLFLALARPQWGTVWEEARQQGLDIVVALDTSKSMLAEDLKPNRLTRAKLAALDLMRLAKSDRFALLPFSGTAFLQCPLTLDDDAFQQSVNAIDVDIIPQGGTDLAAAIEASLAAFKAEGDNYKILVLFSDGEDHSPQAVEAAQTAARAGLRIFTIGVGTDEGDLIHIKDEKGNAAFLKDAQGNVVKSRLNDTLLKEVAAAAHGFYLPLNSSGAIETLFRDGLAPLPRGELSSKMVKRYKEQFQWFLGPALLLLILELLLPEFAREPRKVVSKELASSRSPAVVAVAFVLWLITGGLAHASPATALRDYENGDYGKARQDFERMIEKSPTDPKLRYNAGAAAYQEGAFDQAMKHFGSALASPDLGLQERSYYNLGNAMYRTGEQVNEPDKKQGAWENSIKQFESALKLAPDDADAEFNLQFVKAQLEKLKQQQQNQQNQQQDKKDQQQDQQQQPQQSQDPKEKQDQPNQPQQQPQNQQDQQNQPKQDQQQPKQTQDQNRNASNPQQQDDNHPSEPKEQGREGQMPLEQALRLLDSLEGQEKPMIYAPPQEKKSAERNFKDW